MLSFQYHPDIFTQFPQVVGGVILANGISNGPTPESLKTMYFKEQQATLSRIGDTPLSELESLAAWRSAFRRFGVNPTKYRSAVEALLRRLTKKGDIPSINIFVDACNLVSIRHQLPVAAFDTREITCPITVRFSDGTEHFQPLGAPQSGSPDPGEVIFADEKDLVVARRWCWRQSAESAASAGTTSAIFTIESQHADGRTDVQAALADLDELIQSYGGDGTRLSSVLSLSQRSVTF